MEFGLSIIGSLGLISGVALLGNSRIGACIRWLAFQGIIYSLLPIVLHWDDLSVRLWILALGNLALKGIALPWLLLRLRRQTGIQREIEPFIGFTTSLLIGVAIMVVSAWLGGRIAPVLTTAPFLALFVAFNTIAVGLTLIITRKKAITQVIGYVALENGIYVFGVGAIAETPLLVELGVLLDAFVAVFIMGIAVYHINRTFAGTDVDKLNQLKD